MSCKSNISVSYNKGRFSLLKKSDSFLIAALLSFSGGLQDAYTYNVRDHVFANAQTGNIVLMSQNLMTGNFMKAAEYLLPVTAFLSGVITSVIIEQSFQKPDGITWKRAVILAEIVALTAVGFFPAHYRAIPNMLVSFSCAMQVRTFREIYGNRFASTMCIGNMTAAMDSLGRYLYLKDREDLRKVCILFSLILIFAIGAGFGGVMSHITTTGTIWFSSALLILVGILLP